MASIKGYTCTPFSECAASVCMVFASPICLACVACGIVSVRIWRRNCEAELYSPRNYPHFSSRWPRNDPQLIFGVQWYSATVKRFCHRITFVYFCIFNIDINFQKVLNTIFKIYYPRHAVLTLFFWIKHPCSFLYNHSGKCRLVEN